MQMASYVRVSTLAEALAAAQAAAGPVLYFAGGTDILVRQREDDCYAGSHVIDIYGVEELRGVADAGERLRIGALTTHAAIAADPLVKRHAEVLALASETVGSWQIRSHATIGGNIGNASPAADTFAALAVLDAQVEVRRGGEALTLPLYDVIVRPYATCLQNGDLITAVTVKKLPEGCRSRFYKLGRRRALAISRMTVAAVRRQRHGGLFRYDARRHVPAAAALCRHPTAAAGQAPGRGRRAGGGQGPCGQDPGGGGHPPFHGVQAARGGEARRARAARPAGAARAGGRGRRLKERCPCAPAARGAVRPVPSAHCTVLQFVRPCAPAMHGEGT